MSQAVGDKKYSGELEVRFPSERLILASDVDGWKVNSAGLFEFAHYLQYNGRVATPQGVRALFEKLSSGQKGNSGETFDAFRLVDQPRVSPFASNVVMVDLREENNVVRYNLFDLPEDVSDKHWDAARRVLEERRGFEFHPYRNLRRIESYGGRWPDRVDEESLRSEREMAGGKGMVLV